MNDAERDYARALELARRWVERLLAAGMTAVQPPRERRTAAQTTKSDRKSRL
jgi:hypothetical protein